MIKEFHYTATVERGDFGTLELHGIFKAFSDNEKQIQMLAKKSFVEKWGSDKIKRLIFFEIYTHDENNGNEIPIFAQYFKKD